MRKGNTGPYPKYRQIILDIDEMNQLRSYLICAIDNCIHPNDVRKFIEKVDKQLIGQKFKSKKELKK